MPTDSQRDDAQLRLRDDALEWREVEGEIVALDMHDSVYLAVNKTGAALWPALAAGTTRDELVAGVKDRFDVDDDIARRDVDAFVRALDERGLLER